DSPSPLRPPRDDARRVLPRSCRAQRIELLLQLRVPARRPPTRDHRALRVLPRGRRRRRRIDRRDARAYATGLVARRGRATVRGPAAAPGHAGARPASADVLDRARAAARDRRRHANGPRAGPLPRFRRPAPVLPSRRRRRRRAGRADLRRPSRIDDALRGGARARAAADEHHPRRRRGRPPQARLPADRGPAALRRGAPRDTRDPPERALRRADAFPGRARPRNLRTGALAARARRAARPAARPDDGGDLLHAARRDRTRRLSRADASHVAHATAQALDRMADLDLRGAALRGDTVNTLAVVGAGWAGLSTAVHAARAGLRVHLVERAPFGGGRAREARIDFGAGPVAVDAGQHLLMGAYRECLRLAAIAHGAAAP